MKICTRCKELKSLTDFSPDKRRKSGLQSHCKECRAGYQSSPEGAASHREACRRYRATSAGKEKNKEYQSKPEVRLKSIESGKRYRATSKGKEARRRHRRRVRGTPEGRARQREENRNRYATNKGRAVAQAASNEYRRNNPEIRNAHNLVLQALRRGELSRPGKCEKCGNNSRGIHGHHEDYSKPLEVLWLCSVCHGRRHQEINDSWAHSRPKDATRVIP